ncbi:MAG: hypothetical protein CVU84_02300 [Firmicutes bacterium HGW-Firmicutes-1]|nr:MAG: hypothetical protein CVU84_02300 [Firmicutes bacterium HGW-Firmicutes-1]
MEASIFFSFEKHLLNDDKPSCYFRELVRNNIFPQTQPFHDLVKLMKTEQNPKFHPEGNVWEHTMQVVDYAARYNHLSSNKRVFMWASLLHDIGKGTTTKIRNGKITSYNHDIAGARLAKAFLDCLTQDNLFIDDVCKLVRWHMQPLFITKKLPFSKIEEMMSEVSCAEIGLFNLCDRLGRSELSDENKDNELANVVNFLTTCYKLTNDIDEKSNILKIIYHISEKSLV